VSHEEDTHSGNEILAGNGDRSGHFFAMAAVMKVV
jgi:hypothetical protein